MSEKTTDKQLPVETYQLLDRRDEAQILREIQGELLEDFVYEITTEKGIVRNLSYAGVKEIARRRGGFELLDIKTEETETEIRAIVKIRDLESRFDVLGASTADKAKPFAYVLCHNKTERNALMKLIPAKWFSILIGEWLGKQKDRSSKPRVVTPVADPTPPTTPVGGPEKPKTSQAIQTGIPTTTEALPPGSPYRQFPLIDRNCGSLGMMNIGEQDDDLLPNTKVFATNLVPSVKVFADDSTITGFLIPRILAPLKDKYGLKYSIFNESGFLKLIYIKGKLDEKQIKELQGATAWAFARANERAGSQ